MNAIDIIEKYRDSDKEYAQLLTTLLFRSNFDFESLIISVEEEGKRISFKDHDDDEGLKDEYTRNDIIVS